MTIHLQFSDCGNHIRKWSREPFDGGVAYVEAPVWRGIESAPKDWEPILVWAISESEREDAEDEDREARRAWMVACHSAIQPGHWWLGNGSLEAVYDPIAWLPLPSAPRAEGGR